MSSPHLPSLGPGSRLNSVNLTLEMQGDIFEEVTLARRSRDRISYICKVPSLPVSHSLLVWRYSGLNQTRNTRSLRFI